MILSKLITIEILRILRILEEEYQGNILPAHILAVHFDPSYPWWHLNQD